MGDLATSLITLGYHEGVGGPAPAVPEMILELRRSIVARIFWADKNLAIFMGRPPRLESRFCNLQVPAFRRSDGAPHAEILDFTADTHCSAKFAVLKEECLEMLRVQLPDVQMEMVQSTRSSLERLWLSLPSHFRLTTSLADHDSSPFVRDFLANQRLEYLHTHFLLELPSLKRTPESVDDLLGIASSMLTLVVEVILMRSRLVNSGSHLLWKVRAPSKQAVFRSSLHGTLSLTL